MPLSAIDADGRQLLSYKFSGADWEALKQQRKMLRFRCCDSAVVLKRSSLGLQFFAHHRRGDCISGAETADHLAVKALVAQAAEAAGWTVTVEYPGVAPNGERWIADVLCHREAAPWAKIAFEAQWSHQAEEAYRESGIRCIWLSRMSEARAIFICVPNMFMRRRLGNKARSTAVWTYSCA